MPHYTTHPNEIETLTPRPNTTRGRTPSAMLTAPPNQHYSIPVHKSHHATPPTNTQRYTNTPDPRQPKHRIHHETTRAARQLDVTRQQMYTTQ